MYFKYNTGFCVSYYKNSPLKSDDFAIHPTLILGTPFVKILEKPLYRC